MTTATTFSRQNYLVLRISRTRSLLPLRILKRFLTTIAAEIALKGNLHHMTNFSL